MKTKLFVFCIALIFLTAQPPIVLAQQPVASGDWSVLQSVSAGDELFVEAKDGATTKGKLKAVTAMEISLSSGSTVNNINRDKVGKIYLRKGRSKGKSVLIGAGLGGAAGTGTGVWVYSHGDYVWWTVPAIGLIGAGIGAGIGAIFGGRKKRILIYEAK